MSSQDRRNLSSRRSFDAITDFIFVQDEPQPSDLILIPGSLQPVLAHKAASLYNAGYAPKILTTGQYSEHQPSLPVQYEQTRGKRPHPEDDPDWIRDCTSEAEYLKRVLISDGVPSDAILMEDRSRNTFENAKHTAALLRQQGLESARILLCCKPYHARRALMTFQSELPGAQILVTPADGDLNRDTWMSTEHWYDIVLGELRKCGAYFAEDGMYEKW